MLDLRTTRPIDRAAWHAGDATRPVSGRFLVDAEGTILAFDRGAESFTGWTALEVVGRGAGLGIYAEPDDDGFRRFETRALYEGSIHPVSRATPRALPMCTKNGARWLVDVILTPAQAPPGAVAVELLRARGPLGAPGAALARWPAIDALTGLPSAVEFESRLSEAFALARAEGVPFSILLVEVDGHDAFVEALGPALGDAMLRHAARVIHGAVRAHDMTARLDGAQFGVLLGGTGRTAGRAVGGRVRQAVEHHPFEVDQRRQLRLTVTVGGACHPSDGDTLDELVRRAREALGEARRLGRNRVWIYARRPRVRIITPVFVEGQEDGPIGLSYDISNSGLFVECEPLMAEGARLGLSFGVPGQAESVRVMGRVARVSRGGESSPSGGPGLGIEFECYGQRDRAIIESYLKEGLAEGLAEDRG